MAKKTINNVDDVKRVYEDEHLLREMYNDDVERVKNGEKAIFFGHLNDKPLENVYPEYEVFSPSYLKLLIGLKVPSVYKVNPSSLGITGGDIADGAFDIARGILNLPRTIGDIFIKTGKGVGNILGDGPVSKIWKASIGKWMTYFGRYPERIPAFIDASKGMNGEDDMISFSDAFSDADKKGLDEFEWKGKKYKVEKKKEGGETKPSRRRIDWDKFKEAYGNMKRKGAGHARKIDTEGLDYLYDALYRNNFTEKQIEAIIGNVIEESGGDPFAKAKGSQYKGLFQESNIRYPVSEFEADKKRFEGKKKEYIDYMVNRFNKHVRDAKYYSVKGTKYKKAQEAVDEFFSTEAGIDYSYPLVYAFEAPGDKEGTYKNRKLVSDIISKSYANDGLYEPDLTANKVETKQDTGSNGFGAAFKDAKRKGLSEFVFNGKKYSTAVKEDGGPVLDDSIYMEDGGDIKQKQKKAYDYFTMKRGMSQIQALAILGNLMAESGLKDDTSGDNGTSYGIQQWHNERKDALFKKARKNGHDTPTFEDQLEFLADEYEGKTGYSNFLYARKGKMGPGYYNYSRSDFQDAENLRDAVVAWNQGAGRPHKSVIRNSDRYSAALKVANNLGFDFGLDAGAAPMYGQMGVGEAFIFHEEGDSPVDGAQPVSGTQAVSPQDTAPTTQEDMMKNWVEAYGKGIVAQLMATSGNNKVNTSVDDTTERYRDYVRESKDDEDSKRMALLQAFLPNIQLKVKGVTQVRGDQ